MARISTPNTSGAALLTILWLVAAAAAVVFMTTLTGCDSAHTIAPETVAGWHQGVDPSDPEPPCFESDGPNGAAVPCDETTAPAGR